MGADRQLLELAASISDGTPIDWSRIDARFAGADGAGVLRQLHLVEKVGSFHRSLHESAREATAVMEAGFPSSVEPPKDRWGRYELRERVGEGSYGAVYRAWDPQLECDVALKVLHPWVAMGDRLREKILEEGRALAKVRHQNVVNVYAAETHGGRLGLCMEFVTGRTLDAKVRSEGTCGATDAALIGLAVCRALEAVHAAGFVHRDVKARNVMQEDGGRVVLMDFGTGRRVEPEAPGGIAGTPLYMAPELLAGEPASPQTDIYSVGVLLYFLLTAGHPVEGRTVEELRAAHAAGRMRPLGDRRADLPNRLLRIVEKATATSRADRYESVAEMARDLARLDPDARLSVGQRLALGAATASAVALVITGLGYFTSTAFNTTLGRDAFAHEGVRDWFVWGWRSIVPSALLAMVALLAGNMLAPLWPLLLRWLPRLGVASRRVTRSLRLAEGDHVAQWVSLVGALGLVAIAWRFSTLIAAATSLDIGTLPASTFAMLAPTERAEHRLYRWTLTALVFILVLGLRRAWRLTRDGRGATGHAPWIAAGAVVTLTAVLISVPYRLLHHNQFEMARVGGETCYVLGERGNERLVHCPLSPRPRNRIVRASFVEPLHCAGNVFVAAVGCEGQ